MIYTSTAYPRHRLFHKRKILIRTTDRTLRQQVTDPTNQKPTVILDTAATMSPSPSPIHHYQTGTVTTKTVPSSSSITSSSPKSIYTTPNPFEARFGYHRAVRKGPFIFVSGTTALIEISDPTSPSPEGSKQDDVSDGKDQSEEGKNESKVHYPTDARKQAQVAMERCVDAVEKVGGKRTDVVRVRMFVSVSQMFHVLRSTLPGLAACHFEEPRVLNLYFDLDVRMILITTNPAPRGLP